MFGRLETMPAREHPELLAQPVVAALESGVAPSAEVAQIDPDYADTAKLNEAYDVPMEVSANCVIVTGRRAGVERHAACVVLAHTRADVNNVVRRRLDARKASFASQDFAVEATGSLHRAFAGELERRWPGALRLFAPSETRSARAQIGARRFKTDDRDCAALVWLARQGAGRPAAASGVEAMLGTVAHRRQLVLALKPLRQRLHAWPGPRQYRRRA